METSFFLASNSGKGFYSLYDSFPGEGSFLHIIKGGPGTGKSSFMRRIAKAASERGLDIELILCSGDPDSLDGLYIPALKQAWVDGTAPHVQEPKVFGVDSDYVNLGRFFRGPLDKASAKGASELTHDYRSLYASAYSFLAAEAAVAGAFEAEPLDREELEHMEEIICDILDGERRRCKKGSGRQSKRFISAISCKGKVQLEDSVDKLCKQNYRFDEPLHAHQLLSISARLAQERGLESILCPEPLRPERLEAVLLPELGICFSAAAPDGEKRGVSIHFGKERREKENKVFESPIKAKLRDEATKLLSQAKALHDELEAVYRPYMDFAALEKFTGEYIEDLFK